MKPIAVLGAGSWGTALTLYLARRGQVVNLWSVVTQEIDDLLKDKSNERFLPGFAFPDTIKPTYDLSEAIQEVDEVLVVVPSVGYRETLTALKAVTHKPLTIICAAKGLDAQSGKLLNEVTQEIFGQEQSFAVLSGPSFAREVASGLPTAVVIASEDTKVYEKLKQRFDSEIFRTFPSRDIVGVEIGGITKNVIAVALGISDGLQLGANARSAILTFGFNEMIALGTALGANPESFTGLSGIGDLVLTGLDDLSRNRRLGLALGKGETLEEASRKIGQAMEGKNNATFLVKLAKQYDVKMPLCQAVSDVLLGKIDAKAAVAAFFKT